MPYLRFYDLSYLVYIYICLCDTECTEPPRTPVTSTATRALSPATAARYRTETRAAPCRERYQRATGVCRRTPHTATPAAHALRARTITPAAPITRTLDSGGRAIGKQRPVAARAATYLPLTSEDKQGDSCGRYHQPDRRPAAPPPPPPTLSSSDPPPSASAASLISNPASLSAVRRPALGLI